MKLSIKAGSTSQSINVFIQDSSSTTGAGLTGLVYNSGSLVAYYALPRAAGVAITLATLAAVTSAYSSGGFKEIDATNMPGWYRLDLPDAALASGRFVSIHLKGATNMAPCPIEIELTATDNQAVSIFKKNTALANFEFMMYLAGTNTPATGKTVTFVRNIDGGSFGAGSLSSVTEVGNGRYRVDFAAADRNGTTIGWKATEASCDQSDGQFLMEP
jgi:hypothetical protein